MAGKKQSGVPMNPAETELLGAGVTQAPAREQSLAELAAVQNAHLAALQKRQKTLAAHYRGENRVTVSISPMYAPHFGKNMPVILNGIAIYIPCDGQNYDVPESFAMEIRQRVRQVDEQLTRQKRLSDVSKNGERYAGELDLIQLSR